MKVTTEKLPKSLLALEVELDRDRVEKGLDRAARRMSQKYNIPGFRKGKAPRFIVENYFGREAIMEEASEDLVQTAFRDVLEQEKLDPVGPASLENIHSVEPFSFRVVVPVQPTVTLPAYRDIQEPLNIEPVTEETVQQAMDALRDKHVVLQELDEPRPAEAGDQLMVKLESNVEGEDDDADEDDDDDGPEADASDADADDDADDDADEDDDDDDLDEDDDLDDELEDDDEEDSSGNDTPLVLEPNRLVNELYEGLIGVNVGDERTITAQMPDDHPSENVRGKKVTFEVKVNGMQKRLLPEWDELPTLENFEGTLDELREKTRKELEDAARNVGERTLLDSYIGKVVEQSEFDMPDVMIQQQAEAMLEDQGRQFERYGINLDQMLQFRNKTREEATEELYPEAENRLKTTLALQEIVRREQLNISNEDIDEEVQRLLQDYQEEERPNIAQVLNQQLRGTVANAVLDRKLRARLVEIATGTAPALPEPAADAGEAEAVNSTAEATETEDAPVGATQR